MLLCCRDSTLASDGVQEEIGIASDLVNELGDQKFIIPLRLEKYKKLFGIGELQYVDFVRGWAEGLAKLLETLKRQKVQRAATIEINPNWEAFRRRGAVAIKNEPERLTSNWLRVISIPDTINYFEPIGAVERRAMKAPCEVAPFPTQPDKEGFFSFATATEMNEAFTNVGRFELKRQISTLEFIEN